MLSINWIEVLNFRKVIKNSSLAIILKVLILAQIPDKIAFETNSFGVFLVYAFYLTIFFKYKNIIKC